MKILAINGSARQDGNTAIMLRKVMAALEAEGVQTELVQLGGQAMRGCTACGWCFKNNDQKRCVIDDDPLNDLLAKMDAADGMLLGSPTYFADVTAEMKALIDRAGYVAIANGRFLRRKLGAAVVAVRRGGEIHAFDTINHFFLINEMIVPGSIYWNMGIGRAKGEVEADEEGMATMQTLGENMAWLLKKIAG